MLQRKKAKETLKLYNEVLSKPKFKDRIKSYFLMLFATIETIKILWYKLKGQESIPYQPPSNRVEYAGNLLIKETKIKEIIKEQLIVYNK